MFRCYSNVDPDSKIRVSVVAEHTEGVLKIAVSRCSAKDQFIKKKGRAIAEGRLLKGKLYKIIPMQECKVKDFMKVAEEVFKEVKKSGQIYRVEKLSNLIGPNGEANLKIIKD